MAYDLSFAVNLYDYEGDSYDDCILVFLGNGVILQFQDIDAYDNFIGSMQNMKEEIKEHLQDNQ